MTDSTDTPFAPSTRQAFATEQPRERRNRVPVNRIGGRLKQALDLMVWGDGERRYLPDNEAAAIAGLNVLSIRNALQRPHVLAYYRAQREVLRQRESPANIHRLIEIRDAGDGQPAVNAIKTLEMLGGEQTNKPYAPSPGICIRLVQINATTEQHARTEIVASPQHELEPEPPAQPFDPTIFRVP